MDDHIELDLFPDLIGDIVCVHKVSVYERLRMYCIFKKGAINS
jgi:hypothetical protein